MQNQSSIGEICRVKDGCAIIVAPCPPLQTMKRKEIKRVEVAYLDRRQITPEQRRKAYAILGEIARYTGYSIEEAKAQCKMVYCAQTQIAPFSLASMSIDRARDFISFLIDWCLEWDIPCRDNLLVYAEDITRFLYGCLRWRRCIICGRPAEVHHCDKIGMGRNREHIVHVGLKAESVCRKHHSQAHTMGQQSFDEYYHVYGLRLTEELVRILRLGALPND